MKNLAKFKVAVRTREYLIQAIFQLLFNNEDKDNILQQFEDEHATKKVDFENFNKALIKASLGIFKIIDKSSKILLLFDKNLIIVSEEAPNILKNIFGIFSGFFSKTLKNLSLIHI